MQIPSFAQLKPSVHSLVVLHLPSPWRHNVPVEHGTNEKYTGIWTFFWKTCKLLLHLFSITYTSKIFNSNNIETKLPFKNLDYCTSC